MSINILMPALSPTMTEGKLAKWLVKEGDQVSAGAVIAEIETDKATMEVEAVDEGRVGRIVVPAGTENVQVNSIIAVLVAEGETLGELTEKMNATSNDNDSKPVFVEPSCIPSSASSALGNVVDISSLRDTEVPAGTAYVSQTVREALRDAMAEEMRRDKDVYLMGEEVAQYQGAYKVSQGLLDEFGEKRVIDTPITEHGFAGIAVGSAFTGLRPIVEFMTFNFAMQAVDHIINSAAKTLYMAGGQLGCPIVFRGPNGAAARVGAQHSQDYSSWYAHIPGLKVVSPYSADDAKGLMKAAIRDDNPVIFLENEILYGRSFEVPQMDDYVVPIGKARVRRVGSDVTLIAYSIAVGYALEAAEKLAAEGIQAEVIDLRSLRPIDYDTVLASVRKTNRCVTVEEGWPVCSVGGHLAAYIMEHAFDYLDAPVLKVTGKDVPMPYASNLEKLALPNVEDVCATVRQVCYRK